MRASCLIVLVQTNYIVGQNVTLKETNLNLCKIWVFCHCFQFENRFLSLNHYCSSLSRIYRESLSQSEGRMCNSPPVGFYTKDSYPTETFVDFSHSHFGRSFVCSHETAAKICWQVIARFRLNLKSLWGNELTKVEITREDGLARTRMTMTKCKRMHDEALWQLSEKETGFKSTNVSLEFIKRGTLVKVQVYSSCERSYRLQPNSRFAFKIRMSLRSKFKHSKVFISKRKQAG